MTLAMIAVLNSIQTARALTVRSRVGELILILRRGMVRVRRVIRPIRFLHMTDGTLFLPGAGLMGVGIDTRGSRSAGSAFVSFFGPRGGGIDFLDGALGARGAGDIAVAFEDFFGGDVFVFVEERAVV